MIDKKDFIWTGEMDWEGYAIALEAEVEELRELVKELEEEIDRLDYNA